MAKSKTRRVAGFLVFSRLASLPAFVFFLLTALLAPAIAQTGAGNVSPVAPLQQDTGATGLRDALRRLHTTARLLHTTAHPDDEDGGVLTLESRGRGIEAVLLTLNRGEGGQNKVGGNLFDVLGVLRTLELTASDRYYGSEQRFTRVADFGFSKKADETFQKWQGHDVALSDMVRVIRMFRPDVIVSRFGGTERDGHGNHQASGILSREAFRAAADPSRFPEQIKEGLLPWQAKKFYTDNVCGFRSDECPDKDYTVKFAVGEKSPDLGMTYLQFAMEGLKHQLSQGAGGWSVDGEPHNEFYRILDTVLPNTLGKDGHEKDFFDGIDTSLPALADRLGDEQKKVPFLKPALTELQADVERATAAESKGALATLEPLLQGQKNLSQIMERVNKAALSAAARNDLFPRLESKADQFQRAVVLATGAKLHVLADAPAAPTPDDVFMAVPGQRFTATATFSVTDPDTKLLAIGLDVPKGWKSRLLSKDRHGNDDDYHFEVSVPDDAQYTRPYWHRADPEVDAINTIDDPRYRTLAFPPVPVSAHAVMSRGGAVSSACMVKYKDGTTEREHALAVAPPFSIELEPGTQVIPTAKSGTTAIKVRVRSKIATSSPANLRLELPQGWTAQPSTREVKFETSGESKDFEFQVRPGDLHEMRAQIKAVLAYQDKSYDLGYNVVTREDLDTFYYYQPAVQRVSIVDVKIPHDLKLGYILGAGDDIPTVLTQLGLDVSLIAAEKLATEDLSRFGTIVLGIRAYDTQKEIIANNKKLLDFVSAGGTLIVQYNASTGDFNNGKFTPFPAHLSRDRVSVEEAPVDILLPGDGIFHFPNQITQRDFDGWVQERGLYFMDQWDSKFTPLLSCHDPGEEAKKGGLLRAEYGKGTYIYAGYAFFRQLPAGVPGAIRLYVNLLNAGHPTK